MFVAKDSNDFELALQVLIIIFEPYYFFALFLASCTVTFSLDLSSGSHLLQREQLLHGSLVVGFSLLMQSRHPRPTFTMSIGPLSAKEAGTEVSAKFGGEIEVAAVGNFLCGSGRRSSGRLRGEAAGGSRHFGGA